MLEPIVDKNHIQIAMLGMVEGNGHPYSWSAMFNGYDPVAMAECPYPVIPEYLGKEPADTLPIEGASVTHIWTDDPADAQHVAECSRIPNVVNDPTDVLGEVDAVVIATDKGHEHVDRCRAFVEAGVPIFVDKPLVDNVEDLEVFNNWVEEGAPLMSSSCMRYCKEYMPYRVSTNNLGRLRYASITTPKTWERYGIHALEGIYPILGPGFETAQNTGTRDRNVVHFTHRSGVDVMVIASKDMKGGFGVLTLCGTCDSAQVRMNDTFYAFKTQLKAFVAYLRTGQRPFPYDETRELMRMVIAGKYSRENDGQKVPLEQVTTEGLQYLSIPY